MKRILLALIVVNLAFALAPGAEAAHKKPPILFNDCDPAPVSADEPGRTYKMTTGITCPGDGVVVSADNVTIDLGGFKMTGDTGGTDVGVRILANMVGTKIRNGTITLFGRGIEAPTTSSGTVVDKIDAVDNGAFGILIGRGTVKRSIASSNGTGIDIVGNGTGKGTIKDSVATDNSSDGLAISSVGTGLVDRSTSTGNANRGVFMAAESGTVRDTTVSGNLAEGVEMLGVVSNTVDGVESTSNGGQGIHFTTAAKLPVVTASRVFDNGKPSFEEGIVVDTPMEKAIVTSNVVEGSFGDGIKVNALTAKVDGNTANSNGWGVADGNSLGINAPTGHGSNTARGNDSSDNQCVDDVLC